MEELIPSQMWCVYYTVNGKKYYDIDLIRVWKKDLINHIKKQGYEAGELCIEKVLVTIQPVNSKI